MIRTAEQIENHYNVEKSLAHQLRHAPKHERLTLYTTVYNELYARVPDHPMLLSTSDQEAARNTAVARKIKMLAPYKVSTGTFLEIGAGDCAMSIAMADSVENVVAVEVSDSITESARLPDNVSIVIINEPAGIPVPASSASLSFSDQLAEHLHPEDFIQQCANVFTALTDGGNYVVVTPNRINGPHDVSRGFDDEATGMHLKEYTFTELSELLKKIGFSTVRPIVGLKGVYCRVPASLIMGLEKLLESMPKGLADKLSNTLLLQMFLAIRLVATK